MTGAEADLDAVGVQRARGAPIGRRETSGAQQAVVGLEHRRMPKRPRDMVGLRAGQSTAPRAEEHPAGGEEVVQVVELVGAARRTDVDDDA